MNKRLSQRLSAEELVLRNILPREYVHGLIAPILVSTRKKIEIERVKDILRSLVDKWSKAAQGKKGSHESEISVCHLIRRFGKIGHSDSTRGRKVECPPRAKVYGLRKFWESVGKVGTRIS